MQLEFWRLVSTRRYPCHNPYASWIGNIPLSYGHQFTHNFQESKEYAHDPQTNAGNGSSCPALLPTMLILLYDCAIVPLQWELS